VPAIGKTTDNDEPITATLRIKATAGI